MTGSGDQRFELEVGEIERALMMNRPDVDDGGTLLAAIGGFEVGVLAGVYLAAAATRVPAVVDGLISGAAALVAGVLSRHCARQPPASLRADGRCNWIILHC